MKKETNLIPFEKEIKNKIYTIRDTQVMLDTDLAELYDVPIHRLNEQVKRNIERFPDNFMFQLTEEEYKILSSQFASSSYDSNYGGRRYLPYVFTEQGVSMLSGILRSKVAIQTSIQIINAFVQMRKFIFKNADLFYRLDSVERKHLEFEIKTGKNFKKVFDALQTQKPKQGIFFEGQIFDAYKFISGLIKSAKKSIILLDNYIDESVLTHLSKRDPKVSVIIYIGNLTEQLKLDLKKYNSQYPLIEIKEIKSVHDRFMIIDDKEIYHIGASLKDLGKKWFAFSKIDKSGLLLLDRLQNN